MDYGVHTTIGEGFYANFLTVHYWGCAPITIGNNQPGPGTYRL